jgi:integrase
MAFAERDSRTKKHTGRWAVDFWYKSPDQPDRRMRGAWATKEIAEANEAYARATGQWPPGANKEAPVGPTFASVAADMRLKYDVWLKNRDPSGQMRLDWVIARIGHIPINQVSTSDLDGLVEDLKKRKTPQGNTRSARTINGYLTMASAVLKWGEARPDDYGSFKRPLVPWQDMEEPRIHFMTHDAERLMVSHFTNKGMLDAALTVRALCASGLRWGEWEALEVHMIHTATRADGTPIGWIKLDKTKTNSPRDVPIPVTLARDIKALFANGPRPNYERFRKQFDLAKKVLGLDPKVTIHGMRHATATRLVKGNANLEKVRVFMGHKVAATTQKYTHVESEDLAEIALILNPALGGEPQIQPEGEVVEFKKAL